MCNVSLNCNLICWLVGIKFNNKRPSHVGITLNDPNTSVALLTTQSNNCNGLIQFYFDYIHTYIIAMVHFRQDYGLACHTTHVMCVNFYTKVAGQAYSLTSTPNDRFLRNFFMAGYFDYVPIILELYIWILSLNIWNLSSACYLIKKQCYSTLLYFNIQH